MTEKPAPIDIPKIFFSLALLLLAIGWATQLALEGWASVHQANAAYQKNAENDRAESAIEIAKTCNDLGVDKFRQCIADNLEAHYQQQATNEDLQAQQDMAYWAMLLLGVSAVGVLVSAGGVILLIATIRQGKAGLEKAGDAVDVASEANNIMRQEQRPWLVLNRDLNCEFRDIGDRCTITWNYEFENRGKNPAYDVALNYAFIKRAHYMHMRTQMDQYLQHVFSTRRLTGMSVIFPGEKTDFIKYYSSSGSLYQKDDFSVGDFSDEGHVMVMACLSYRLSQDSDIFGYDVRMLDIEEPKRWAGPWAHTLLEHAEARLIG